jgi:hypothetical protein
VVVVRDARECAGTHVKDSRAAMSAGLEMRAGTPRPRGLISPDDRSSVKTPRASGCDAD